MCSSDLGGEGCVGEGEGPDPHVPGSHARSEERLVGKECRSRGSPEH